MPSPRTKPQPLSDSEIQQIAAEIAGGRPPMVWFTAAAVGVPEGRSGKVISLGDPADGDFLQVRPTGSKDVLSFSPTEVTLTKPPRGATAQPKQSTRKESPVTQSSTTTSATTEPAQPSAPAPSATPKPAQAAGEASRSDSAAKQPPAPKPAKAAAARKAKAPEVTVTLTGTADGEWSVDVVSGKKRTLRGLPVAGSAVAQAAKILHPEVAEVVAGVLEALRGVQEAKVQQLQAELEEAKRLLDELSD
ncbi:DUF6319 family protein [Nocardia beijingensis]|uniref:DUF6319 family protein n=1 Tax=Nocardia beijingensis TaxID=95162 RepID=UPI0033C847AB